MASYDKSFAAVAALLIISGCLSADVESPPTAATLSNSSPTTNAPPNVAPPIEAPLADVHIEMILGQGATAEIETKLSAEVRGYVHGTGSHAASYMGPGGPIDIYEFQTAAGNDLVASLDLPAAVCRSDVKRGAVVSGFGCGSEQPGRRPERGILHTSTLSGGGENSMLVSVGSAATFVVLEIDNGLVYSIRPAGGLAYAYLFTGEVTRVTVLYPDGSNDFQLVN